MHLIVRICRCGGRMKQHKYLESMKFGKEFAFEAAITSILDIDG